MPASKVLLCIDDEPTLLELRKSILAMHGYRVVTATSGKEGLRLVSGGQTVDLVLLDYSMPGMMGDQVAQELKKLHPKVPIVAVSAFPQLPEAFVCMTTAVLPKGEDPEVMIATIAGILGVNG